MKFPLRNRSELTQRIIAALVGVSVILGAIFWSEWSYFALFFFICMFCLLEFYKLLGLDGNLPLKTFGTLNGLLIYVLTFFIERGTIAPKFYMLIFIGFSAVYLIKLYRTKDSKPFVGIALTFLGVVYIGVPFAMLNIVVFFDGQYHSGIIIGSLFMLWASDTGAYFSGKNFGKRKLFERISPKKTWEGSLGGAILAAGMGYLFSTFYSSLSLDQWLSISAIIVIAGTYGDLIESLFKRSIMIKDSGRVIPGHGGFLDRFDGLLIASPFIAAYLKLFS